ncbi:Pkinase-domain-containing protein [Schizopora paradoxa]|uniref:non-specific serine/threonine protein kinase n=1 Tax=Schizopora paradoxa TaxID=27342 RepID=A0A0H2RXS4_9AGAM|nr:Pkinase-domain-containing protein [Schizopora paradoxa]
MADVSTRLQIPDVLMAGPSQAVRQAGSTRPASTQVYHSSAPHAQPSHSGSQSARKRASHTVTSSQPQQQQEQAGFRDVYSHPAAVAYAAAHPRRSIPKFGPYLLLQTLGEGEFGKVKLGLHCQWGEEVAVKLIRRGNIDTAVRMSKVEREIEVLRTIKHPNIVRLYDVIETDKYIGIILEYASGGELFDHILAHRYLKEKDACKLFAQLISGVWYIHQKKIVHRDLKLENLLLDRHRNVIITDFGFANRFEHRTDDLMQTSCGSPCYAAPELVISEGAYVGSAVDIWSCGVILYAMLAGYLPFDDDPANPDGDNINLLYRYIVNTPLTFPDYVSGEARELLSLMLVPDPARRANLEMIMQHSWLAPYAHLFERSVQDLERMAMEQHQMKRLAYQRQMKQQSAPTSADQSKLQRSQSARQDVPPVASVTHGRHGPPSSAHPDYLYETNADESIFSSPPPVPVVQASGRRHVASAIVVPTSKPMDDDPFGPSPTIPVSPNLLSGDASMEVRTSKSKEINGKPARKNPPPVAIAPVKMSPERKKTDRQRHTIQLEYGDDAQDVPLTPKAPPTPRGKDAAAKEQRPFDTQPDSNAASDISRDRLDAGGATDTDTGYFPDDSSQASTNVTVGGAPNGVKPLPTPPTSNVNGSLPQKYSASSPSVVPMDILQAPPIVSITPTSPPRMDTLPPSSYDGEKTSLGRSVSGSIKSAASDSSRNKHRRGMSIDKIKGMFGSGSGSDNEGSNGLFSNGSIKRRRPSETSVTKATPRTKDSISKHSTLQVVPSADPKKSPASSEKSNEGKKSRRNTLTGLVEPISKQIRQRSKARTPSTEARREKEVPQEVPSLSAGTQSTQESDAPLTPRYSPTRPEISPIITDIPASTSKASKVMQWFRYRSKSRGPSDGDQGDKSIGEDYEKVPHPDREASVTPTAASQHSNMFTTSPNTFGRTRVPSVVTTPADGVKAVPLASDASVPHTPHVNLTGRARGVLSNILSSPAAPRHGSFNKEAIHVHHGAVDHTMVTTGSPPDVMAHVTKVLLDMGLEVQQETDYKLRCVRAKRRKAGAGATGGVTAITMVGSAGSNGVDKRGLPIPSQSSFSSTGGMLKGLLMRRQSSQVSNNSIPNSSFTYEDGPDASSASLAGREKISVLPTPPAQEPIFGDRTVDQGDEVRFSVELTRIDRLDDTFTVDIRRLKGNLRSYKFLYDAIRERCQLSR